MATLIFDIVKQCFLLHHGDKEKSYLTCNGYEYLGKKEIPKYTEYNDRKNEFVSVDNFYNSIVSEENRFLYPRWRTNIKIESELNDVEYMPIQIPISSNSDNKQILTRPSLENILALFDISFTEYLEFNDIMKDKGYSQLIIKDKLKLYLSRYNESYFYTLFKGKPTKKSFEVDWKDRFNVGFNIKIPSYYKKKIKCKYTGGSEGEIFIFFNFYESWRNLFKIPPYTYLEEAYSIPYIVDYDMPCKYSKEQIEYMNEQESLKQEHINKENEVRIARKHMDGYCDICGSANAHYRAEPYMQDMYNKTVMVWLCDNCYNNIVDDI